MSGQSEKKLERQSGGPSQLRKHRGRGGEGRERKGEGMLSRKNSKLKISAIVGNASENHFIIL